jgi:hypothetical protein
MIQCWPTDPLGGVPALQVSAPVLPGSPLGTSVIQPPTAPTPKIHPTGSAHFRYWTGAEALRRTVAFWSTRGAAAWNAAIGSDLPVRLDDGVDLNAYYARTPYPPQDIKQGLSFFHDTVFDAATSRSVTVYSGESADIVAHELGHAVLDAIKPELWGVSTTEAAAFHESFGDMSAILAALQLPSVCQGVLEETAGRLSRNSTVSRVAEQLGWAIRQRRPDAVDPDSLRNASNSFVYTNPLLLPPSGPASNLTRAPHNFSRVFTGAFLECLANVVLTLAEEPDVDDVQQGSRDMGELLARAIIGAPVRTTFFRAVAEQLDLAQIYRQHDLGLVIPLDPPTAAGRIRAALADETRMREWSLRGQEFARTHLHPRVAAERYLALYQEGIDQRVWRAQARLHDGTSRSFGIIAARTPEASSTLTQQDFQNLQALHARQPRYCVTPYVCGTMPVASGVAAYTMEWLDDYKELVFEITRHGGSFFFNAHGAHRYFPLQESRQIWRHLVEILWWYPGLQRVNIQAGDFVARLQADGRMALKLTTAR